MCVYSEILDLYTNSITSVFDAYRVPFSDAYKIIGTTEPGTYIGNSKFHGARAIGTELS